MQSTVHFLIKKNVQQRIWMTATKFELERKRWIIRTVWINCTSYLLQLYKIGIFQSICLPSLHPSCFWCWTIPNPMLSLCGSGFTLFAVRVLAKLYHFGVNWSTTFCKNKDGVHFFTLKFECHNRYNNLLLCNSENGDIAWRNKNRFLCFFRKEQKPVSFQKYKKNRIEKSTKTGGLFWKKRFFLNTDCLSILFVILRWSQDLEEVTSPSVWLGVRRTLRVSLLKNVRIRLLPFEYVKISVDNKRSFEN